METLFVTRGEYDSLVQHCQEWMLDNWHTFRAIAWTTSGCRVYGTPAQIDELASAIYVADH